MIDMISITINHEHITIRCNVSLSVAKSYRPEDAVILFLNLVSGGGGLNCLGC